MLLKHIAIDGDQEKTLAELSETIIPATTTPGAKDVSAHLFVLTMVDDCFTKADRDRWQAGFAAFEKMSNDLNGKNYLSSTPQQREALLTKLETVKDEKDDAAWFYQATKRLTIRCYTSSKFYLTKVQVYELVPSRYKGCVPYKPAARKVA
ncbi:gluconate 2-dehydrogenase subunit 3 family protein [Deminuibacter soli]|nr:gluconate 2-dehydrogenase subunit 3 family protein [Deminuibacter soli]